MNDNAIRRTSFLALALALCGSAHGEPTHYSEPIECATSEFDFDSTRISTEKLQSLLTFSPLHTQDWDIAVGLAHCPPEVDQCGAQRSLVDFPYDADRDLAPIKEKLAELQKQILPKELRPVYEHYNALISFWLWKNSTRVEFGKTWKTDVLRSKVKKIDPGLSCADVISKIEKAPTKNDQWRMADVDWQNCVSAEFYKDKSTQAYPKKAWNGFLTANGVRWKYAAEKSCD